MVGRTLALPRFPVNRPANATELQNPTRTSKDRQTKSNCEACWSTSRPGEVPHQPKTSHSTASSHSLPHPMTRRGVGFFTPPLLGQDLDPQAAEGGKRRLNFGGELLGHVSTTNEAGGTSRKNVTHLSARRARPASLPTPNTLAPRRPPWLRKRTPCQAAKPERKVWSPRAPRPRSEG